MEGMTMNVAELEERLRGATPWIRGADGEATGAIIMLHGSGDSGAGIQAWLGHTWDGPHGDFEECMQQLGVSVHFPTAQVIPYSMLQGQRSSVWFDRFGMDWTVPEHMQSIENSYERILSILNGLVASGIPSDRIVVGGMSMGGCMALQFALRFPGKLAGVFVLSSFMGVRSIQWSRLGVRQETDKSWSPHHTEEFNPELVARLPKVLMLHGVIDSFVMCDWGAMTAQGLASAGVNISFQTFPDLDHEIGFAEVGVLVQWLTSIFESTQVTTQDEPSAMTSPQAASDDQSQYQPQSLQGSNELPMSVRKDESDSDPHAHIVTFRVPKGWEEALCAYPITARGAQFALYPGRVSGTIECKFHSPLPDQTAKSIHDRLLQRLSDPAPPGAESCTIM